MKDNGLYERHLRFDNVRDIKNTDAREQYEAIARSVRDILSQRWVCTENTYTRENPKRIYYLSMEFLIGRSLTNNLINLRVNQLADEVVRQKHIDLLGSLEQEPDAGLGIFLGTISRSMAQYALLIVLVVVLLQLLSGGNTPVESQPRWLQYMTFFLPSRHFVSFSQIIIYRGGGISAAWPNFLMVSVVGLGFFMYSLALFRKSIAVTK